MQFAKLQFNFNSFKDVFRFFVVKVHSLSHNGGADLNIFVEGVYIISAVSGIFLISLVKIALAISSEKI